MNKYKHSLFIVLAFAVGVQWGIHGHEILDDHPDPKITISVSKGYEIAFGSRDWVDGPHGYPVLRDTLYRIPEEFWHRTHYYSGDAIFNDKDTTLTSVTICVRKKPNK